MKKTLLFLTSFAVFALSAFHQKSNDIASIPMEKLSDYHFFEGKTAEQKPALGVVAYSLNTPLFTDYAEKLRFVKLPENQTVAYNDKEVLGFPVGTTIIKTFYYPNDFRKPESGRRLMETRLLIHENEGWKALDYVWNDEQTEAFLEVAGDTKEVNYVDANGKKKKHEYVIPNLNQCKGCHNRNEKMTPIGPSARQLNGVYNGKSATNDYLQSADNQRFAQGYDENGKANSQWDFTALAGAGGIRSTVSDMVKYVKANMSKAPQQLQEAVDLTQKKTFSKEKNVIGLGWILPLKGNDNLYFHNGGTGGFRSFAGFDKERQTGIVILSNATESVDGIGFGLLK